MGILPQQAAFILREHKHRPIEGDILLIGRQTVWLTLDQAYNLLKQEGIEPRRGHLIEYNHSTMGAKGNWITDRSFFSLFSSGRVIALDVNDFEGAEIVHDLNSELPERFFGIADFIYNGSCLDNLFDPAMAMRSTSKMLRPLGRILDAEHSTAVANAFICYSPEWFFDFFAINNYADCQVFICKFGPNSVTGGGAISDSWQVHWWRPFRQTGPTSFVANTSYPGENVVVWERLLIMCCAEKGTASTDHKTPIQACYRVAYNPNGDDHYIERYQAYIRSGRTFGFSQGFEALPNESEHEPVRPEGGTHNRVAAPYVGMLPGSY